MTEIKKQLVDWLDDLCVRFIINLPKEELKQVERICFQVEEAQWYYEDFIRPLDPELPSMNLKRFCLDIFKHCPLLSQYPEIDHSRAFDEFLAYKTRVPVRGAILVNQDLDSVLLVRGWKQGASWSFPRGKINKDEPDLDCAIREVYEETGFNILEAGLVPKDEDAPSIEMSMRAQHIRLYVFRDVPMDTHFAPRTRKEIGKIQWYKLSELPTQKKGKNNQTHGAAGELANHANRFYMVAPFIHGLKKWISQQKKLSKRIEAPKHKQILTHEPAMEAAIVDTQRDSELPVEILVKDPSREDESARASANVGPFNQKINLPDPAITPQPSMQIPLPTSSSLEASIREQKSQSLLALLQGKPANKGMELPQTPAEQIVKHPQMPPSPKHHYLKPKQPVQEIPPLLHATNQALQSSQNQTAKPLNREEFILNALRSNQPESSAGKEQRNPQESRTQVNNTTAVKPSAISPFASLEQTTGFASAIPAASKLPPPKLTAQSSRLLDLFKSNKPTQAALEAAPIQVDISHLGVKPNRSKDFFNAIDQASLEVSEIEDHHIDNADHRVREPSEVSFEMPANVDTINSQVNQTPPRSHVGSKSSPRENLAAWQKFQDTDTIRQNEQRRQAAQRDAERAAEEARTGVRYQPQQPVLHETWKKVEIDESDERRVVGMTKRKAESKREPTEQPTAITNGRAKASYGQESNMTPFNGQPDEKIGKLQKPKDRLNDGLASVEAPAAIQGRFDVAEVGSKPSTINPQPREMLAVIAPSPTDLHPARSDHQNTLLSLLKAPSGPSKSTTPISKSTLEAPAPTFELSAIPSPGHSRDPSRLAGPLGVQPVGDMNHIFPMSQPAVKRQKATLAPRRSPVSATVDGPLNVPQFDMLAQKHQSATKSAEGSPKADAPRKSPITILARPSQSQIALPLPGVRNGSSADQSSTISAAPQATMPITIPKHNIVDATTTTSGNIAFAPRQTTVSQAAETSKPAELSMGPPPQPQTIRRPLHIRPQNAHDSVLSPISPLPSPKHSLGFDRRTQQTKEQKKSLLSLFNNPSSPTPSPAATGSPVAPKKERDVSDKTAMAPPPLPPTRVDSTASALISPPAVQVAFRDSDKVGKGLSRAGTGKSEKSGSGTGSGRETPKDTKSFLLGYLDSVAMGKR